MTKALALQALNTIASILIAFTEHRVPAGLAFVYGVGSVSNLLMHRKERSRICG